MRGEYASVESAPWERDNVRVDESDCAEDEREHLLCSYPRSSMNGSIAYSFTGPHG